MFVLLFPFVAIFRCRGVSRILKHKTKNSMKDHLISFGLTVAAVIVGIWLANNVLKISKYEEEIE